MTRIQTTSFSKFEDFQYKYALSICAASIAETVTYPLDIVKTRLQVQGEDLARGIRTKKPKGFFSIAAGEFDLVDHELLRDPGHSKKDTSVGIT